MRKFHKRLCRLCHRTITRFWLGPSYKSAILFEVFISVLCVTILKILIICYAVLFSETSGTLKYQAWSRLKLTDIKVQTYWLAQENILPSHKDTEKLYTLTHLYVVMTFHMRNNCSLTHKYGHTDFKMIFVYFAFMLPW